MKSRTISDRVILKASKEETNQPHPNMLRMDNRINTVLSLLKKNPHTLSEIIESTHFSERSVMDYLKILRHKKLVMLVECPKCQCLNRFYIAKK